MYREAHGRMAELTDVDSMRFAEKRREEENAQPVMISPGRNLHWS